MYSTRPLNRFRDIAKFIMHNKENSSIFQPTIIQDTKESSIDHVTSGLDPKLYSRPAKEIQGTISGVVRQLLTNESTLRTEKDIDMIINEINKMPFFDKLDHVLLKNLASVIYYQSLDKGRVIVRQGHIPIFWYYIVDGEVSVLYSEMDPITDQIKEIEFTEIYKGSYFGHLAFLSNTRRELTFVCKGPCQFFVIEDEDFNELLKDIIWNDLNEKIKLLINMPALDEVQWTDRELRIISTFTKIVSYPINKVILGGTEKQPKHVYFIKSGNCRFVRAVQYTIESDGFEKQRYIPFDKSHSSEHKKFHKVLLEICIVKYGSYFGVGEDMTKTYLIAIDNVSCILIPRSIVLKYTLRKYIEKLCKIHNRIYPSEQEVLDIYCEKRKLMKIQKNIVEKTLQRLKLK